MLYGWRSWLYTFAWLARAPVPNNGSSVAGLVCGFWRSGTTLLHECLATNVRWRAPTTHECMNPGQPDSSRESRLTKRPTDNLTIDAASPQEDEFGLLALGAPSFYRVLLCPEAWPSLLAELELGGSAPTWDDRREKMRLFIDYLQSRDARPLILKSPPHAFYLPQLLQLFPDAWAVVILRNWADVWLSCQRMWAALFGLYAIGPWTRELIADMTAAAYHAYTMALERQVEHLPAARVAAILYEDLVGSPVETLRALALRVGATWHMPEEKSVLDLISRTKPDEVGRREITSEAGVRQRPELAASYERIRGSVARLLVAPEARCSRRDSTMK